MRVDGVPVTGDRPQDLSVPDVEKAISAMRADLPEVRSEQLRIIEVVDSDTIYLGYREAGSTFVTRYVVRRKHGQWHYTWRIAFGPRP